MEILVVQNTNPKTQYLHYTPEHIHSIREVAPEITITLLDENSPELPAAIARATIIVLSFRYDIGLEAAVNLRWLHTPSAGIDDFPQVLRGTKFRITNSSGVHVQPVTEYVLMMMLALAKEFPHYYRLQQQHIWRKDLSEVHPQELFGKTITIVGMGRIGTRIAVMAEALGMNVTGVVRDINRRRIHEYPIYGPNQLRQAVSKAAYVVNVLPLTEETKHVFNKDVLAAMPHGAYFINVGRGGSIVEEALADSLDSGHLAGAAIDVAEQEPLPETSRLWECLHILITPHVSSTTRQYADRVIRIFIENLEAFMEGRPMPHLVDIRRGY